MNAEDETPTKKPDGSTYRAHMEALEARNNATRKAGRAERTERETHEVQVRRLAELDQEVKVRKRRDKSPGVRRPAKGA